MTIGSFVILAIAVRDLWIEGFRPLIETPLASLVFIPGHDTVLLPSAVAAWMIWRRRTRFEALDVPRNLPLAGAFFGIAAALVGWSRLIGSADLLPGALAGFVLGAAALARGRAGVGCLGWPSIVLLLAIPIPSPLEGEIVWALQRSTAAVATLLLNGIGIDSVLEGTQLRARGIHFDVLEGSSGWRLIQILVPVAIGLADLEASRSRRVFTVCAVTTLGAFVLNVLRTAFIVGRGASSGPPPDATTQAIVLLVFGLAIAVAVARIFGGRRAGPSPASPEVLAAETRADRGLLGVACLLLAISLTGAAPERDPGRALPIPRFDPRHAAWTAHPLPVDYTFPYSTSRTALLAHAFVRNVPDAAAPRGTVELFVAYESRGVGGLDRLPASKVPIPAADWHHVAEFEARRGRAASSIRVSEYARNGESEFALVYSFRLRDRGLLRESLRALFGLDVGSGESEVPPAVVRLGTPMPSQLRSDRRRAMRLLDAFVSDMDDALERL